MGVGDEGIVSREDEYILVVGLGNDVNWERLPVTTDEIDDEDVLTIEGNGDDEYSM